MDLATTATQAMTLDEWKQRLQQLPPEVRSHLADVLAESVERETDGVGSVEGKQRYEAYLRGEMEAYPLDEALNELRAKMLG